MAAAALARKEYEFILDTLKDAIIEAKQQLEIEPPQITDLQISRDLLNEYIKDLEKFRPTTTAKKDKPTVDDFEAAIKAIYSAKPIILRIERKILTLTPDTASNTSTASMVTPPPVRSSAHIPSLNIKIPTFDGTFTKYSRFINSFKVAYHGQDIAPALKFIILQDHLTGPALAAVVNLPIDDKNYEIALKILDEKFNKTDTVIALLYEEIQRLPPAAPNNESLRNTFDEVEARLKGLEAHGENFESNYFLRNTIFKKTSFTNYRKLRCCHCRYFEFKWTVSFK
jgi:hypothetical protein